MQPKNLGLSLLCAAVAYAVPQVPPPIFVTVNVTIPTSAYDTPSSRISHSDSSATVSATVSATISTTIPTTISTSISTPILTTILTTNSTTVTSAAYIHIQSSALGFGDDSPTPTKVQQPYSETTPTGVINGPTKPGQAVLPTPTPSSNKVSEKDPASSHVPLAPVYTLIKTVVDSRTTEVPVFISPGSSEPATLGQTVTLNDRTTVLAPPKAIFTTVSTTVDGVATKVPVYIISGSSTALLGQTVTIDGTVSVLSTPTSQPKAVFTTVSTTIDGVVTEVPVYVFNGSSTASLGQTVTLDGTVSVLSTPTSRDTGPETTEDVVARGAKMGRAEWSALAFGVVGVVFGWL